MRIVYLLLFSFFICSTALSKDIDTPKITASDAINIVKKSLPYFKTGKTKVMEGKSGVKSINVELLLDNKVVAYIRVNPQTGEILPKGYRTYYPKVIITEESAKRNVDSILSKLQVGNPWLKVNKEWRVPIVLKNSIISEVSVDGLNGEILIKKSME